MNRRPVPSFKLHAPISAGRVVRRQLKFCLILTDALSIAVTLENMSEETQNVCGRRDFFEAPYFTTKQARHVNFQLYEVGYHRFKICVRSFWSHRLDSRDLYLMIHNCSTKCLLKLPYSFTDSLQRPPRPLLILFDCLCDIPSEKADI